MTYYFRQALEATPGLSALANDNVSEQLEIYHGWEYDQTSHIVNVADAIEKMLGALFIDTERDHNTKETARRVAKMYVTELMAGRFEKRPAIATFPNIRQVDELYTVGPIAIRSLCSHHLMPIIGSAWVGVVPSKDKIIGLSKFSRLARWIFARPQIQEEATQQYADLLEELLDPIGLAVVVKARHMCMILRGVQEEEGAAMVTSVMRGAFFENPAARGEFLSLIK